MPTVLHLDALPPAHGCFFRKGTYGTSVWKSLSSINTKEAVSNTRQYCRFERLGCYVLCRMCGRFFRKKSLCCLQKEKAGRSRVTFTSVAVAYHFLRYKTGLTVFPRGRRGKTSRLLSESSRKKSARMRSAYALLHNYVWHVMAEVSLCVFNCIWMGVFHRWWWPWSVEMRCGARWRDWKTPGNGTLSDRRHFQMKFRSQYNNS